VLRLQRADALLSRTWGGDALWALTDCDTALQLLDRDSRSSCEQGAAAGGSRGGAGEGGGAAAPWLLAARARIRRAQALKALGQLQVGMGGGLDYR
jgi:hypothetical protein